MSKLEKAMPLDPITRRKAIKHMLKITGVGFASLLVPTEKARAGWGACSVSGCPCRGYQQAYGTDLCGNCGHGYSAHW